MKKSEGSKPATWGNLNPGGGVPVERVEQESTAEVCVGGGKWVGVNYSEMARQLGLHHTTVMRYFAAGTGNRRRPSVGVAEKMARYLGVTMDEVIVALGTGRPR